jgi:hypothetical protein
MLIFALAAAIAAGNDAPRARKSLIVGIDGCRPDLLEVAKVPALSGLIRAGSYSHRVDVLGPRKTNADTVSLPGWTTALSGVWPDKHKVLANVPDVRPAPEHPLLFARLRAAKIGFTFAGYAGWAPFVDQIMRDEPGLHMPVDGALSSYAAADAACAKAASKELAERDPDATFVYFAAVDDAGHRSGFHPRVREYRAALETVDGHLAALLAAIEKRPRRAREDWLFAVCTDHGGRGLDHRNGAAEPEIRTGFMILSGAGFNPRRIAKSTGLTDLAPAVLRHHGVKVASDDGLDGDLEPWLVDAPAR